MSSHHNSDCIDIRSIVDDSLVNRSSFAGPIVRLFVTFDDWKSSEWCRSDANGGDCKSSGLLDFAA